MRYLRLKYISLRYWVMNKFNSFGDDEGMSINIDKLAQEMALTLKKLNENKSMPIQKSEMSQNSLGSLSQFIGKPPMIENVASQGCPKRDCPIKITAYPRKRNKTTSENQAQPNEQSVGNDSMNIRRITDYFGKPKDEVVQKQETMKKESSNEDQEQSIINNHPVIKNLREKISEKKKHIQQLSIQIEEIKENNSRQQEEIEIRIEKQRNILIEFMVQKYSQRIYNQGLKEYRESNEIKKIDRILEEIVDKIQVLKSKVQRNGRKNSKSKSLNEEFNKLQVYGQQRQNYFNNWRLKLESEKKTMEKQIAKAIQYIQIQIPEEKHYPLPEIFLDESGDRKIFEKIYLPLYCRNKTDLALANQIYEVRVLNLQKLVFENLLLIAYPKVMIMKIEKRMALSSYLKDIHMKSLELHDEYPNSIFIKQTIFAQAPSQSPEFMVLGRNAWEQDSPTINLKHIIKRYESLPENIAKYIVKIMLRAHERIKKQLNHQAIIFPQNIIFNQRNDIKIDNWVYNQTYRFPQYHEFLVKDSKYFYLPPEYKIVLSNEDRSVNNCMGIWTVGIILYEMLYGKKPPFQQSHWQSDYEEFYLIQEIEFPVKPQILDSCKEFIRNCLTKPENRMSFEKALKHPFLENKK